MRLGVKLVNDQQQREGIIAGWIGLEDVVQGLSDVAKRFSVAKRPILYYMYSSNIGICGLVFTRFLSTLWFNGNLTVPLAAVLSLSLFSSHSLTLVLSSFRSTFVLISSPICSFLNVQSWDCNLLPQ
jgi:hypothetical protein